LTEAKQKIGKPHTTPTKQSKLEREERPKRVERTTATSNEKENKTRRDRKHKSPRTKNEQEQKRQKTSERQEKDEEDAKSRPLMLLTRAAAFEALGYAFAAASPATKKATFTPLCDLLTSQYPLNPWNVQIALLGSVRAIVKSINSGPESFAGSGEVQKLVEILFLGTENVKYSVVRNAALEAFCDLVQATKDTELLNPYVDKILAQLDSLGKDNAVQLMADNLRQLLDAHPLKKKPKTG